MRLLGVFSFIACTFIAGCSSSSSSNEAADSGGQVASAEDARRAYLGLDASIDKAITLGFDGFNSASSANISPQTAMGAVSGKMVVTGQVDQGQSNNKGMRLVEELDGYSDGAAFAADGGVDAGLEGITYATSAAALPALTMSLKGIPTGTLSGTLNGAYTMSGTLSGTVTLMLTFTASLQANAADPMKVERKPGTSHITGTAVSPAGTFNVDITR
ncbi:MAG: hypothetical protein ABIP89_03585 [Polyangiaceae bacterium]